MIGWLKGNIVDKGPDWAIVETGGVGYHVICTAFTASNLASPGEEAKLHVYTHVRENEISLFAFSSRLEKDLFMRLISVNDIGPRKAIVILSGSSPAELIRALSEGNIPFLTSLQGIGKKTAERLVVEMKDRLQGLEIEAAPSSMSHSLRSELLAVLTNLGYRPILAEKAVEAMRGRLDGSVPLELLIREALSEISKIG
jgi:Holliday junction DNA helicase RuvA